MRDVPFVGGPLCGDSCEPVKGHVPRRWRIPLPLPPDVRTVREIEPAPPDRLPKERVGVYEAETAPDGTLEYHWRGEE
ncbi:MAG TPA: hypothetical protein VML95_09505 [Longimicrobiales bacterium]|nr:hypothetical protein [Longimicrobiales bacterium]